MALSDHLPAKIGSLPNHRVVSANKSCYSRTDVQE
jgi:hypothetical protein